MYYRHIKKYDLDYKLCCDWEGIYLEGSAGYTGIGEFDYCRIRYGGHTNGSADANIFFDDSDGGHFDNSFSEYSAQDGLKGDNNALIS